MITAVQSPVISSHAHSRRTILIDLVMDTCGTSAARDMYRPEHSVNVYKPLGFAVCQLYLLEEYAVWLYWQTTGTFWTINDLKKAFQNGYKEYRVCGVRHRKLSLIRCLENTSEISWKLYGRSWSLSWFIKPSNCVRSSTVFKALWKMILTVFCISCTSYGPSVPQALHSWTFCGIINL